MSARHRLDDRFLAEIARQYNAHVKADWPPLRAIALANRVTYGTAANWITRCRRRGIHLECGQQGLRHHYPTRARNAGEQP